MMDKKNIGIEILESMRKKGSDGVLNGHKDLSPDMGDYILEFIFGTLYAREGLDLKTKQMITITALAVLGNARPQLEYHIQNGLNIGLSKEEIINIMIHISGYAGFPAALNGISACREVFSKL
jgi:4-carboxymuconolactone decarboxylase